MIELSPDQVGRSSAYMTALDDQLRLDAVEARGLLNLEALFHDELLVPDAYFHTNVGLAQVLVESDFEYCKAGIVVPVLRRETLVGSSTRPIRSLADLHQAFLDVGMYKNSRSLDAEKVLVSDGIPKARDYHMLLSQACSGRSARVVRNPSLQASFEQWALSIPQAESQLTRPLLPNGQWEEALKTVKLQNNGKIPGRTQIYQAVDSGGLDRDLLAAADFVYYMTMYAALGYNPAFSYPHHVDRFARGWYLLPLFGPEKSTHPKNERSLSGAFALNELSRLSVDDLIDLRKRYLKGLRKALENPAPEDLHEPIEALTGAIWDRLAGTGERSRWGRLSMLVFYTAVAGEIASLVLSLRDGRGAALDIHVGMGLSSLSIGGGLFGRVIEAKRTEDFIRRIGRTVLTTVRPK